MGYKQSSGKGIGKHAQGIIAPIEGLIKALPAVSTLRCVLKSFVWCALLSWTYQVDAILLVSHLVVNLSGLLIMQGLSLDYINEVTATRGHNNNVTGVGAEEALEQHKSDIKLDIVARFNAAQRAGKTCCSRFK